MRFTTITLSLLALLAAPAARADEPVTVAAATPSELAAVSLPSGGTLAPVDTAIRTGDVRERPWYALSDITHHGVQLDVGAPGAGGATVLFRPWWWLRFNAGLAYNYLGFGLRGGVSVAPFHWAVTPTLNLDYGHFLSGDASRLATNAGPAEKALLQNVPYDFATAQVGLEFGSQRWFSFYVRDMSRFTLIHGSISAVVIFLVWIYISAVILLYGVEFTAMYARLRRHRPEDVPAAPAPRT
jgi:hypothetical protein